MCMVSDKKLNVCRVTYEFLDESKERFKNERKQVVINERDLCLFGNK